MIFLLFIRMLTLELRFLIGIAYCWLVYRREHMNLRPIQIQSDMTVLYLIFEAIDLWVLQFKWTFWRSRFCVETHIHPNIIGSLWENNFIANLKNFYRQLYDTKFAHYFRSCLIEVFNFLLIIWLLMKLADDRIILKSCAESKILFEHFLKFRSEGSINNSGWVVAVCFRRIAYILWRWLFK